MNGGTCIDGIDNFTCSCPTGLIGLFCECLLLENGDMDCNYTAPETSSIMYTTDEWNTKIISQQYTTTKTSIPIDDKFYTIVPNVTADISSTTTIQIPTPLSTDTSETSTEFNTLFTTTISNAFYTSLATLSTMFTDTSSSGSSSSSSSSSTIDSNIPSQSTVTTETELPTTIIDSITISKLPTSTIEPREIIPPIDYTTTTISSSDLITTATSASMPTTLTPYFTDSPQSPITKTISSQIPSSTTMGTSSTITDDDEIKISTTTDTTISSTWQTVTTSLPVETLDTTTMSHANNFTGMPDCTKIPCFNGGTCAGTSEGAKVISSFFPSAILKHVFIP